MSSQDPAQNGTPRTGLRTGYHPDTPEEKAAHEARQEKWIAENWEAIQSSNRWVEENGLPQAKYRMF